MNAPLSKEQWADIRRQTVDNIDTIIAQVGRPKALLSYQSKAVGLLESAACRVLFIEKSRRVGLTWGFDEDGEVTSVSNFDAGTGEAVSR